MRLDSFLSTEVSIESFYWEKAFENLNVNEQVNILNSTLLNIFRNFIPNEMITCRVKDPPWLNNKIKTARRKNNKLYRKYISGGRQQEDESKLNELSEFTCNLLTGETYFNSLRKKLNDPNTAPKTYWSILKRLMNKIKIPEIPPLPVDGIFETNLKKSKNLQLIFC